VHTVGRQNGQALGIMLSLTLVIRDQRLEISRQPAGSFIL